MIELILVIFTFITFSASALCFGVAIFGNSPLFLIPAALLFVLGIMILDPNPAIFENPTLPISNSTAHEICVTYTNDSSVVASAEDGNLVCEILTPSKNVIIRGGR